jgi:hypothetical protein
MTDALHVRTFLPASPENTMRADGVECEVVGVQPTR